MTDPGPTPRRLFEGDPYPRYRELRARGPIHRVDDLFGGAWVLTTFEGVQAALKDPRLSAHRTGGWIMRETLRGTPRRQGLVQMQRLFARAMLFVDKPAHPRLRRAMQAGFRPERIRGMGRQVEAIAADLLRDIASSIPPGASFDFIERFARLLPARVIAAFLGLQHVDQERFLAWSTALANFLGSVLPSAGEVAAARDSLVEMGDCLADCLRHGEHADGLLADLVQAQARGEIEDGPEMLAQCAMLLFAGHETTRHFLGSAVFWLLQDPARWQALADGADLSLAVRELLRWDSPVQYTGRRAATSFELCGQRIARGDLVLPLLGAANRDPLRYPDPDVIDLRRPVGLTLSFGSGPHVCIGASLTLLEAECALAALVRAWPHARLTAGEQAWLEMPLYRGLRRLGIRRDATADAAWPVATEDAACA